MWNLNRIDTGELLYEKTDSMLLLGMGGGGIVKDLGIYMYTVLYLK